MDPSLIKMLPESVGYESLGLVRARFLGLDTSNPDPGDAKG